MASDLTPDERKARRQRARERKDLRLRGELPQTLGQERYYRKQAEAIFALQMREAVMRWTTEKVPDSEIAKHLGCHPETVKRYRKQALLRSRDRAVQEYRTGVPIPLPKPRRRKEQMEEYERALVVTKGRGKKAPPGSVSGTVLDPEDVIQLRKECLVLRKAMVPFDKMAVLLGITEETARDRTYEALAELETSERLNSDLQRRLQVEQIDQMIEALHPAATGWDLKHGQRPVVLEAVDRMLKLLKQKAELLGLSEPPAVDIRIRLQALAAEGGYDIVDVEEVARGVLAAHKIRLPDL
jgi:DNA-binding CsgD family transcriptional regulator